MKDGSHSDVYKNVTAEHKTSKYFAVIGDCSTNKYNEIFFLVVVFLNPFCFLTKNNSPKVHPC